METPDEHPLVEIMSYTHLTSTVRLRKREFPNPVSIDVAGIVTEVPKGWQYKLSIQDGEDFYRQTSWFVSDEQDQNKEEVAKSIFEYLSFLFLHYIKAYERDFKKRTKVIE